MKGIKMKRIDDLTILRLRPSIKRALWYVKYYKSLWEEKRVKRGPKILLHWCKHFLFNFLFEDDWDI